MKFLAPILLASIVGNGVQIWLLRQAWQAEATAIQACETRIEAGALAASEAVRLRLTAAYDALLEAEAAENRRTLQSVDALRRGITAITEESNAAKSTLRATLARSVDECAGRAVPVNLLERVRG